MSITHQQGLHVAGLFAGIGGFELGLSRAGHHAGLLVDNSPLAAAVLARRFPTAVIAGDVRSVRTLPSDIDLLVAGFPCQDLSSVGRKQGIDGERSALIGEVFRLLARRRIRWVVLENVPFLLQLEHGRALELITGELSRLGYAWAYRVIDAKAFGIPQRRRRWYLVASLSGDPRDVLLAGSADPRTPASNKAACGFYWTEGTRALGWAVDAIPPLKGGSSVGVPSPPAIVFPDGRFVTPDIRDAERLQGFPANWTLPAEAVAKPGYRWLLVGNAVAVRVAAWLGCRLTRPGRYEAQEDALWDGDRWPDAAWALPGESMYVSQASSWPVARPSIHLADFLRYPTRPLSERAALGFLRRADGAKLRFPPGLLDALRQHIASSARAA